MALPHTPKRDKQVHEKQVAHGYISYLSPKGSCKTSSRPQFDFHLQNTEGSVMKAKGFGEDNYNKLLPFMRDKSPVKMQLFTSEKYPTPTCGYSSNIRRATPLEVPFSWDEKLKFSDETSGGSSTISKEATITEILSEYDLSKYYTVTGKLHKGKGAEKRNQTNRIKEDNVIFQEKENIRLTIWNDLIDEVEDGKCYSFSHIKLSDFNNDHLTTSFYTIVTPSDSNENILVPDQFEITDDLSSVTVQGVSKVGRPDAFLACGVCKKKVVESNIRSKAYTCFNCEGSHVIGTLLKDRFVIDVTVVFEGGRPIVLVMLSDVAIALYDVTDPQDIADELFSLVGCTIQFNTENNFVCSVKGLLLLFQLFRLLLFQ